MVQNTDMLRGLIEGELQRACSHRPTKRLALEIALSLLHERQHPGRLKATLWRMNELRRRVERALV